jgi:hypothetical protein
MVTLTRYPEPFARDYPQATLEFIEYVLAKGNIGSLALASKLIESGHHPYLCDTARDAYLGDAKHLASILQRVLQPTPDAPHYYLPKAREILDGYRRVFATLLYIGRGYKIGTFLEEEDLKDDHGAWADRPRCFPDTGDATFWKDFRKAQWMFFVKRLEYRSLRKWPRDLILPFERLKVIDEGNSGIVFQIRVHHAYNALSWGTDTPVNGMASNSLIQGRQDIFCLKTFRQNRHDEWEKETKALQHLRGQLNHENGTIGFYGCYKHDDIFNILIEYADGGNLEDFLKTKRPPTTTVEIMDFWRSMHRLIGVLARLDGIKFYAQDDETYRG